MSQEKIEAEIERALARRKLDFYAPYPKQKLFHKLGGAPGITDRLLIAGNQLGKELHNDTKVMTPTGWVRIGDLRGGDRVIAGDGTPTRVIGVYPQGVKPLYKLTFDRGETILAGAEHLWKYRRPADRYPTRWSRGTREPVPTYADWSVGTTIELLAIGGSHPTPRRRVVMPFVPPVQLDAQPVPIDPYIVGLLLGDGCLSQGHVTLSSIDPEIVEAFQRCVEQHACVVRTTRGTDHHAVMPGGKGHGASGCGNPITRILHGLGMMGKLAHEKRVPSEYLWNTCEVRQALLQGLMDTDGSVSTAGAIEFSTTSPQLAEDVTFLVQSFGGKVANRHTTVRNTYTYKGEIKRGRPAWRLRIRLPHITPFRLTRKVARLKTPASTCNERVLWSIEESEPGPATCIAVEHDSKTFVIEHGIVTHNTFSAGAETAMHLTGEYPSWWEGHRFTGPIDAWAACTTSQSTRDAPQRILLGKSDEWGTGSIPGRHIIQIKKAVHGVSESVETVLVTHVPTGKTSRLVFKTYDQGRERWIGETLDLIWFDEEPPADIFSEGKTRLQVRNGILYITFTPLLGMTEVVTRFLKEKPPGSAVVTMTIHDALHYTPEQRQKIIAGYPEHERKARSEGIPIMGSGRVFPIEEELLKEVPIQIPEHWPRICGMDIGWDHPTAAVWIAWDRDTDTIHVYDAYRVRQMTPVVHAAAIKARGIWIPVAWPHDGLQHDTGSGAMIAKQYREYGVNMLRQKSTHAPEKGKKEGTGGYGVEAGVLAMLDRMQTGRFKVAEHLNDWFEEFRMYYRQDGLIVKKDDDLMSATRMACMMLRFARTRRIEQDAPILSGFTPSDPSMGVLG